MVANIVGKGLNYAWRGLKTVPTVLFTEGGAKAVVNGANTAIKASTSKSLGGTLWTGLKGAGRAAEATTAATKASGGLLKSIGKNFVKVGTRMKSGWAAGAKLAAKTGKNAFWTKLVGAGKGLSKALPGIGNVLMAVASIPTIYTAFKDGGVGEGVKEIVKEGAKLGGGAIGAAIGSALGPIGTAVGWIAGSWLTSLFTGKSASEKKAEAEQLLAEQDAQLQQFQQVQQATFNPYASGLVADPTQTTTNTNYAYNNGSYRTNVITNPWEQDIYRRAMGFDTYC